MRRASAVPGVGGDRTEVGLLAERAAEHIRSMIASGRLGPGDKVNEVEIAAELEISRGPVREAVRRFASTGLVVSERNLGSRVVQIDELGIRGLYEVRESLESLAAKLAATRMSAEDKRHLIDLLDRHEAAMSGDGFDAYPAGTSDWDFHLAVLKGSGNAVAWRICGSELRDMFALLRARHGQVAGRGKEALCEHRRVAEAICAGDADIASVLMAQHIRNSYRNLLTLLDRPAEVLPEREAK
jgi:DNA-binding GntR family transcriptional regulator